MRYIYVILILLFSFQVFAEPECPTETLTKTMIVTSMEGELSDLTFIRNNKAYIKLYVSISYEDEMKIWKDLIILDSIPEVKSIEVYIDNYGGMAYSGFAIHDLFKRYQDRFDMEIKASGVVASAAVAVFLAFEKRYASENTFFMVHEIAFDPDRSQGRMTASDIKTQDQLFDKLEDKYLCILEANSDVSREAWEYKMEETTWFSAKQAKEWGIVKEIK